MDLHLEPAATLKEERPTASLLEQARIFSLLYDIGKELTAILDLDTLLRRVGERVKLLVDCDLFNVMILKPETNRLECVLSLKFAERVHGHRVLALGEGLCGTTALERKPIRVSDVSSDPRYISCACNANVQSELVVPIIVQDRVLGVLDLESLKPDAFTEEHEQMLVTLASTVGIAYENASLYDQLRRAEQHRKEDMQRAREVQELLLPKETPRMPGIDVAALYLPAQELGGDFYDFVQYGDEGLAIAVGDVAGKGPAAALLASLGVGILREHAIHQPAVPAEMLADLNGHLQIPGNNGRFIAMVFGLYNPQTRELALANAGFPQPFVISNGRVRILELAGTPLGLLPDSTYDSISLRLAPGDAIVFCSDGVLEQTNASEEEYGIERMISRLAEMSNSSTAEQIAAGIASSVDQHAHGNSCGDCSDDRTIVVLRVKPDSVAS